MSKAYESLVADARRITGGYMRDAWHESPITQDSDFPYALDFSALEAPKRLYLDAAMKDLRSFRVAFPWLRTRASR